MSGTSPSYKSRAPAINPFDKLNQKQFDSYISSIQSKIKVALDPPSPEPQHLSRTFAEISRSTIASPAPSPAPLSKRPSQDTRPSSRATYTPVGAGTPNEPFELSDDEDADEEDADPATATRSSGSRASSEASTEDELEPLSAIPERSDEGDEEVETDDAQSSPDEVAVGNDPGADDAWPYSGEDASEDDEDELSEAEDGQEEEEDDVFVGKGKGRHPAEGPGLAGLRRSSGAPESPERTGRTLQSPENSFEIGVARMPVLGTTSTPFIPRTARRGPSPSDEGSDDDAASPPWEGEQDVSMPTAGGDYENEEEEEGSDEERASAGAGQHNAIEVLDSDEESDSNKMVVDQPPPRPTSGILAGLYGDSVDMTGQSEFDELQFDYSAAYPNQGHEPDSLLDDTMGDNSVDFAGATGNFLPKPSSLFTGSGTGTREPSQSKDDEELDHSANTVQGPEYSVEEPDGAGQVSVEPRLDTELDQPSIQKSMDYSDFLGEHSLLNQHDTSRTQAEEHFLEVTVFELENGSRYYDHDGVRHFLNPEGQVYETCPIPPPKPTIQRPPDLSMIQEVTELDITRRALEDDEDETPGQLDFLKGLDDTFSSVGAPILRYPNEDDSTSTFDANDIPRPGAAMGFRGQDSFDGDASAFLSQSAIMADGPANQGGLRPLSRNHSMTGTLEESMTGRNSGDLVSEADDIISESDGHAGADADSLDSILDDDDSQDTSDMSTLLNRSDLITPVPLALKEDSESTANNTRVEETGAQDLPPLDEKDVADALAAVAQMESTVFNDMMDDTTEMRDADANAFAEPQLNTFDGSQNLDNLMDAVNSMSQTEEDLLARSFSMADALQNATVPMDTFEEIPETVFLEANDPSQMSVIEGTITNELMPNLYPAPVAFDVPEKLASEVLAEVFEGVDPIILPSGAATGTATPYESLMREPEPIAHIEEIEEYSRSATPKPSAEPASEDPDPSPRRTPPTPTLSVGQSLTAPEQSIATSVSGIQQNVSIYASSSASSTRDDDHAHSVPPEPEPDVSQLPDPTLPPAPTHLSMPSVPNDLPEAPGARREISPSVMVEPPTPHARSEDGVFDADSKSKAGETRSASNERMASKSASPTADSEQDEEVDVDGLLSEGENTSTERSRNGLGNDTDASGHMSESRTTPTPPDKIQAGDKRKRLDDDQSPMPEEPMPLELVRHSPSRLGEEPFKSPVSDTAPLLSSPAAKNYHSLFKRVPTRPMSTASNASSRKTSGSDGGPAPWPMRHRTHQHARPATTSPAAQKLTTANANSPMTRSNCRFHRITIPVDDAEDNTLVEFVVPACALGDREVLKENGIEDCGPSTSEEEHAMVTNLEDLEPSLVKKLTILAGASLLGEGVCGYIDKPSVPKVSRPVHTRSRSLKGSWGRSSADRRTQSPGKDKERRTLSPRAKPKLRSRPSINHDDRLYKPPAESESDDSAEDEPTRKKSKQRTSTAGATSSVKFPTLGPESPQKPVQPAGSPPSGGYVPISKRMKRARRPADAQPFKPDLKDQESSTDTDSGRSPRKRTKRQNSSMARQPKSKASTQERQRTPEGDSNPFKPKRELKRMLSPKAADKADTQPSISAAFPESHPTQAEQKDLERHIALGDKAGEVVDEDGKDVNVDELEPSPAMVAAHVDRSAHNEMGKKESNGSEAAPATASVSKRPWHRFLRF